MENINLRWSLKDLFISTDDAQYLHHSQVLEDLVSVFEKQRDELTEAIQDDVFIQLIQQLEKIHETFDILYGFVGLKFHENTQDQAALAHLTREEQKAAYIENRCMFFTLWWKDLPRAAAEHLLAISGDYHYWLEKLRSFKAHSLSEPEEKIVNLKNVSGIQSLCRIYETITNRYTFQLQDVEAPYAVKTLTREALMAYVRHPNQQMRERAYDAFYAVYTNDAPLLSQIYQAVVQDWHNEQVGLRNFSNPNAARNLENDIPDAVVDTLLSVCQENASVFQRFFHLKAQFLGQERMQRKDVYAPVGNFERHFDLNEAKELVLSAFHRFEPKLADLVKHVFDAQHVDSENRPGKQSGAFCWSVARPLAPWVLLNFQNQVKDGTTLAHELGHAIHAMLASHHSLFTYLAPLPLAETASTFAEMLLIDRLLTQEKDEQLRLSLLFQQIEEAYATVMRQAFFALFERKAHEALQKGMLPDELSELYLQNLQAQFGNAVEVPSMFRWEWVTIPHFYQTPFYVYAYSFGQLLVLSLYQQYRTEGKKFVPSYMKILSAGGSQAPARLLAQVGIDITQSSFWQSGFDVIRQWIDELERIIMTSNIGIRGS